MLVWPTKGPTEAALDYDIDWTARLAGDTITSSAWALDVVNGCVDGALILGTPTFSNTITKILLSGGTADQAYVLTNTVVTAAGRTEVESVQILVKLK